MILCLAFLLSGAVLYASESDPIRIGATVSLEGKYKEPSEMIHDSLRLWENEVNKKGGLLGRPVKLILYNDKSDKQLTRNLYRKLITEDRVDLVLSPYGSPLTLVASEVSEKHQRVMLAVAASAESIWDRGYRYVFGVYALGKRYFIGQLDLMARKGFRTLALAYDKSSPFNVDVIEGTEQWAKRFRMSVLLKQGYENNRDLVSFVEQLKKMNPDGVVFSAYSPDCYKLLEIMAREQYKPKALGMTIAPIHPDFLKKAGAIGDGVFGPSQWEPDERIPFPGTKKFIRLFREFAGKSPSYHAGSAYAACQLYESAIRQLKTLDNDAIRNYISGLDTVTVIGRFKVDGMGKQVGHNPILIQWQNGKKEIVWPQNMQTANPVF